MMTSTFPSSRSNHSLSSKQNRYAPKEIQSKKESLMALEAALKKRISEFRELCIKEAELTGHLPNDYPLQPREPIPQIRRRINSNNNLSENISIIPPRSIKSRNLNSQQQFVVPSNLMPFPSRPTSTNSTNSTNSTSSSLSTDKINQILNPNLNNHQLQHKINGIGNFQPYFEETKPFQMSDFYKYSSKHRQKVVDSNNGVVNYPNFNQTTKTLANNKTTRQLQEDVKKKNSLKFTSCDDQIQASVKLIENSGQKLIEATARAIAVNPGLAEKLSNIIPNNNNNNYSKNNNIERY